MMVIPYKLEADKQIYKIKSPQTKKAHPIKGELQTIFTT
jgi:hypothetical protein